MTATCRPRLVAQVTLAEGSDGRDRETVAAALTAQGGTLPGVLESHVGAHLPLSVGGGDLTWDLLLEDEAAADAFVARCAERGSAQAAIALGDALARVAAIDFGRPEPLAGHVGVPGLVGIKRTLWLRVEPGSAASALARFEAETPLLAEAIPAIRNWRWSRLAAGPLESRWTHLWEQEFETVEGLEIDYMSSPVHWGYIDRWFDPEMPERIVDLWLAHLACPETAPVLSWDLAR